MKDVTETQRVGRGTTRKWSSTEGVRTEFLDAARKVFAKRGFSDASVTEVVEQAGASVGSLYHHFGSKTELFVALWERHHLEQQAIAADAVVAARADGVSDPFDLFIAGSQAYLGASWARRDLVKIFSLGDTPPGFQEKQRAGGRVWIANNFRLLGAEDEAVQRALVFLATTFLGEARREIANARTAKEARELVAAMTEVIERMRPMFAATLADRHDEHTA
ncbi:TetR family transcriptional regulator [Antricoccus suffuscus]|uniref:TetR family transcriptional regulator n=1 Tax=Antricoccus suffuscus TaxID=1629062 RepID=A0A2T1A1V6_9ACTN|nr:TetR family transcriptional regulator [Antricoccus suffuscus]